MKQSILFLEPRGTTLEIIRIAKKRGYVVVALSSDPSMIHGVATPYQSAISCIDRIETVVSWQDYDSVLRVAMNLNQEVPIAGIYNGVDPCAVIVAKLRRQFGLPTSSAEAMALVLDKFRLRQALRQFGLSKIQSFHSTEVDQWDHWPLTGPAYFKPVHGFFSAYVSRCGGMEDLKLARASWTQGSDADPAFVKNYLQTKREYHLEEAFDGELLSVEAISLNGNFHSLGLTSRILYSKNPVVEMGSVFPYPHSLSEKIVNLVKMAHEKLGITDDATHTEVIVNKSGEIEIIDLNPRFVGADVMQSINNAYGVEIQQTLLDVALGQEPKLKLRLQNYSCLQYVLPPQVSKITSEPTPI